MNSNKQYIEEGREDEYPGETWGLGMRVGRGRCRGSEGERGDGERGAGVRKERN